LLVRVNSENWPVFQVPVALLEKNMFLIMLSYSLGYAIKFPQRGVDRGPSPVLVPPAKVAVDAL
jgi:hypothetical protein